MVNEKRIDPTKSIVSNYLSTQERLAMLEGAVKMLAEQLQQVTTITMMLVVQNDLLLTRAGVTHADIVAHKEKLDASRAANPRP